MARLLNILLITLGLMVLSGCFTVKSIDNTEDKSCHLLTKELEMEFNEDVSNGLISGKGDPRALIPLLVIVPPVSFIVSGSVSIVGNAIHWVEKQGRCSDDSVKTFTKESNAAVIEDGGKVVTSSENFADWLKKRHEKSTDSQDSGG